MMSTSKISIVFSLFLFLSWIQLPAQEMEDLMDMSLDDLLNLEVTTASKKAEKISDAPGIITVITAKELKSFGATNLMEALERTPSYQPMGSHMFRNNVSIIRGDLRIHQDSHVLLLLDGRPVRDGANGGLNNSFYTGFPINWIEKVEIVRGPGSVLYGSKAYSGVINVITKQPSEGTAFGVSGAAGSFGAFTSSAHSSMRKGDLAFNIAGQFYNDDGWNFHAMTRHPAPIFPDSLADVKFGQRHLGIGGQMAYKNLKLSGLYTRTADDALSRLPYAASYDKVIISRLFLNLGYQHQLSDRWHTDVNVTTGKGFAEFDGNKPASEQAPTNTFDVLGEVTIHGQIEDNINLVFGGVLDTRHQPSDIGVIPVSYDYYHYSAYAQADFRPVQQLKLIAGAQLNKPDGGDADIVPRFGVIYNFENGLGFKTLYGQAFKSPAPIDRLINVPGVLVGNPNLTPEKVGTFDAQVFYAAKNAEIALTYFFSHYTDLENRIPYTGPGGGLTYINQGRMNVEGIEFEVKASISPRLFLLGSMAYQNNKDNVTFAPHTMAKLGATYNTPYGLSIAIFNTFFGKSLENNGAKLNPAPTAVNLVSANLAYSLRTKVPVRINLYGKNLLNQQHHFTEFGFNLVNTYPISAGRSILLGVSADY